MTVAESTARSAAEPLVSVIVPCHNYGHLVDQALASVQSQGLGSWEAIVVDDGSTDRTAQVIASLAARDPRIRYAWQPHAGLSAARNRGLRLARGRYIQFLDADDLIEECKLAYQAEILEHHAGVGIVYGAARYFDSDRPGILHQGLHDDERWMPCISGTREVLLALLQGNIMVVQAALTRRDLIEEQGGFDLSLPALEDWDLWLRCAIAGARFVYADKAGARSLVRVHPTSMSRNSRSMGQGAARVREKLMAMMPHSPVLQQTWNDANRVWQDRIEQAAHELWAVLPETGKLIIVDEDQILSACEYRSQVFPQIFPLMERDGRYCGRPADDAEALKELTRLVGLGAVGIAFAFNAFWWLDHYPGLRAHLAQQGHPVHISGVLRVYELTP